MVLRESQILRAHDAHTLRPLGFACAAFAASAGIAAASPASFRGEPSPIDLTFLLASGELQAEAADQYGSFVDEFDFWNVSGSDTVKSNVSVGVSSLMTSADIEVAFSSGPDSSQFLMTFLLGLDGSIDDYDTGEAIQDARVTGFIALSSIFAEFELASPHLLTVTIDPGAGESLQLGKPFMVDAGTYAFSEVLPYSISLDLLGPDMSGQEQRTVSVMLDFIIPTPGAGSLAFISLAGMAGRRRRTS